jgi:signal transduction histidine kinase
VAAEVAAGVRAVLDGTRDEFRTEYPCHAPDRERWFLLSVTPLGGAAGAGNGQSGNGQAGNGQRGNGQPGDGRPGPRRGAVVAHFDITDRKKAEQALARRVAEYAALAHRLEKSNEELDQFAYVTSHDLRAPLRGIANLSRWIEEDIGEHFTPEAHRQMELLRGRVHRMEAMIDGILEYSRVGRVRHRMEKVDVAVLLAEVIDLLDVPPTFTVEVAAGMPTIFGERLRLQQVFQNLIGNAIKHHDKPAGRIRVGWKDAAQGPGEWVEFLVSDDGPGIEPRYHEKVFVIFQTMEARDKVEGTGVGLSLVRKIVESQGGTVTVESEKGKGATFRFTWPKQLAPGGGGATDDGVDAPAARERS